MKTLRSAAAEPGDFPRVANFSPGHFSFQSIFQSIDDRLILPSQHLLFKP